MMMTTIRAVCHNGARRLVLAGDGRLSGKAGAVEGISDGGWCSSDIVWGARGRLASSYNEGFGFSKEMFMEDVVIISGVRTPIGKFQGSLEPFSAPQLGAIAVREAVKRANVDPGQVDECIMGLVVSAGLGANPARPGAPHRGVAQPRGRGPLPKRPG